MSSKPKYDIALLNEILASMLLEGKTVNDLPPGLVPPELVPVLLQAVQTQSGQQKRERLAQYSTIDQAVDLINTRKNIIFIVGAGISVSTGIPDFRSPDGFYEQLKKKGYKTPQDIFSLGIFKKNPELFYGNASIMFPSNYTPSPSHRFIAKATEQNKVQRVYTQNIDTLENKAGVTPEKIIYCHGSVGKAHCLRCGKESELAEFEPTVRAGNVPRCAGCLKREAEGKPPVLAQGTPTGGGVELNPPILKPNVTFFGEDLDPQFFVDKMNDFPKCDLLIVSGTSLKIGPVNTLIFETAKDVPQILVDRQPVGPPEHFDFYLLGDSDDVFGCLAQKLGWEGVAADGTDFIAVHETPNITRVQRHSSSGSASSSSSTSSPPSGK